MGSHFKNGRSEDSHLHRRFGHLKPNRYSNQHHVNDTSGCEENKKDTKDSYTDQLSTESGKLLIAIPKWMYCYLPLIAAFVLPVLVLCAVSYQWSLVDHMVLQKTDSAGWEMVDLFGNFDIDGDMHLSFEEALPLIQLMSEYKKVLNETGLDAKVSEEEQVVELEAHFIPLELATMTKDWVHDINNNYSFHGLFEWKAPNIPRRQFGVSTFRDLLPQNLKNIPKPGVVYRIISPPSNVYNVVSAPSRSTRHYPPQPFGKGRTIHGLLSMLHPRPFVIMRFAPQGAIGVVRAISKTHVHILLRIHAEFQLNEPPRQPFWYTPAQLSGSLVMTKDGSRVEHFHLYVPAERNLNVDMEWLTENDDPNSMEVDIGYMPLMELISTGPSRPQTSHENQGHEKKNELQATALQDIVWDKQISEETARDALEVELFPFKMVKYHNISKAFKEAETTGKLVHSILLWGALDDQSC